MGPLPEMPFMTMAIFAAVGLVAAISGAGWLLYHFIAAIAQYIGG